MADDTAKTVAELHVRLAELDRKVDAYRQDLASEFLRYFRDLLKDLPDHLSHELHRALAESLSQYPSLSPVLLPQMDPQHQPADQSASAAVDSTPVPSPAPKPAPNENRGASRLPDTDKPLPVTTIVTASPAYRRTSPDSPGSPRRRDHELQALFAPSYLPLLDGPHEPLSPKPTVLFMNPSQMESAAAAHPVAEDSRPPPEQPPAAQQLPQLNASAMVPLTPVRRASSDTSGSPTTPGKSEYKIRRSALRRHSSSSSKIQSPRRVRFEFEGTEVLPSSSPEATRAILESPTPLSSHDAGLALDDDAPPSADLTNTTPIAENTLGLGLAYHIEQPIAQEPLYDDEFDPRPPRKVSSTQALRALSKLPLDSSTVWTSITQDAGPSIPTPSGGQDPPVVNSSPPTVTATTDSAATPTPTPSASLGMPPPGAFEAARVRQLLGAPLEESIRQPDEGDSDSDDADFLSLGKHRSASSRQTVTSPGISSSRPPDLQTDSLPRPPNPALPSLGVSLQATKDEGVAEDDVTFPESGMFLFDGEGEDVAFEEPAPEPDDTEESRENGEGDEGDDGGGEPTGVAAAKPIANDPLQRYYSSSPAVDIPGSLNARAAVQGVQQSSRFLAGSVGSYKGRTLVMPVVVNPEILQEAAQLGDFSSFVGGLDGRSGMDEADVQSFRASLATGFSGTPKSLAERMLLEESMGARGPGSSGGA